MPIVTVVDLPLPPSVNRIWQRNKSGKKKVSRSPVYKRWLKEADQLVMAMGAYRGVKTIYGPFDALIEVSRKRIREARVDPSNLDKALLDWAQSRLLIENDKHLEQMLLKRVDHADAPYGVRMTLTEASAK